MFYTETRSKSLPIVGLLQYISTYVYIPKTIKVGRYV